MKVLAIDIGGTKSVLGLCQLQGTRVTSISGVTKLASSEFTSLQSMISLWCRQHPALEFEAIGAGVAGPVADGRVPLTNLGWSIDALEVSKAFGKPCRVCNDMEAHGWGILGLNDSQRAVLNVGRPVQGSMALIAAGTGLGEAIIGWSGQDHFPMPGEGGHASFSPTTPLEDELLLFLRGEIQGHVSWERVLGGRDGFRYLALFLASHRSICLPDFLADLGPSEFDWGPAVIAAADRGDPFARDVVGFYATLYGRESANLALKCIPKSGVYLGGGIAGRIRPALAEHFMRGFTDKGRFSDLLKTIPVFIVLDEWNGLKGAAIQYRLS
jgi:glucokinase